LLCFRHFILLSVLILQPECIAAQKERTNGWASNRVSLTLEPEALNRLCELSQAQHSSVTSLCRRFASVCWTSLRPGERLIIAPSLFCKCSPITIFQAYSCVVPLCSFKFRLSMATGFCSDLAENQVSIANNNIDLSLPYRTPQNCQRDGSEGHEPHLVRTFWELQRHKRQRPSKTAEHEFPVAIFQSLPREVYECIVTQLELLHLRQDDPCSACYLKDLWSLSLVNRAWNKVTISPM
jgi:hypothetical protein